MAGEDAAARDEMAWPPVCGIALANAGLGAVHGLAGPLGGLTGAAHGAICGALLPHVLMANRAAVADPARLDQVGRWIGQTFGLADISLQSAAQHLGAWARQNGLPTLTEMGIGGGRIIGGGRSRQRLVFNESQPCAAVGSHTALHHGTGGLNGAAWRSGPRGKPGHPRRLAALRRRLGRRPRWRNGWACPVKAHRLIARAVADGVVKVSIDGAIVECAELKSNYASALG